MGPDISFSRRDSSLRCLRDQDFQDWLVSAGLMYRQDSPKSNKVITEAVPKVAYALNGLFELFESNRGYIVSPFDAARRLYNCADYHEIHALRANICLFRRRLLNKEDLKMHNSIGYSFGVTELRIKGWVPLSIMYHLGQAQFGLSTDHLTCRIWGNTTQESIFSFRQNLKMLNKHFLPGSGVRLAKSRSANGENIYKLEEVKQPAS